MSRVPASPVSPSSSPSPSSPSSQPAIVRQWSPWNTPVLSPKLSPQARALGERIIEAFVTLRHEAAGTSTYDKRRDNLRALVRGLNESFVASSEPEQQREVEKAERLFAGWQVITPAIFRPPTAPAPFVRPPAPRPPTASPMVRDAQRLLNAWNGGLRLDVDGLAGKATRAAVLAFQRQAGLPETGRVTRALINAITSRGVCTA